MAEGSFTIPKLIRTITGGRPFTDHVRDSQDQQPGPHGEGGGGDRGGVAGFGTSDTPPALTRGSSLFSTDHALSTKENKSIQGHYYLQNYRP